MTEDEAIDKLYEITDGILHDEVDYQGGWWETSGGAEFGDRKLKELELLIHSIYKDKN